MVLAELFPKDASEPETLISKTAPLELGQLNIRAFPHPPQKQLDSDVISLFSLQTHSSPCLAPGSTLCPGPPAPSDGCGEAPLRKRRVNPQPGVAGSSRR